VVLVAFERFARRGPTHLNARVNLSRMSGRARTSRTVSASSVGRFGVNPRSAQYRCTICPPTRHQEGPRRPQSSNSARQARS
jgi:hypothetical protein